MLKKIGAYVGMLAAVILLSTEGRAQPRIDEVDALVVSIDRYNEMIAAGFKKTVALKPAEVTREYADNEQNMIASIGAQLDHERLAIASRLAILGFIFPEGAELALRRVSVLLIAHAPGSDYVNNGARKRELLGKFAQATADLMQVKSDLIRTRELLQEAKASLQ